MHVPIISYLRAVKALLEWGHINYFQSIHYITMFQAFFIIIGILGSACNVDKYIMCTCVGLGTSYTQLPIHYRHRKNIVMRELTLINYNSVHEEE